MSQQNDKLHALQQRLDLETQKLADKDVQVSKLSASLWFAVELLSNIAAEISEAV